MTYTKQYRNRLDKIVILSASLRELSQQENEVRTNKMRMIIRDFKLPFKEVQGVYRNSTEDSFLVVVEDDADVQNCLEIAEAFQQESILFSDKDRNSKIIYSNVGGAEAEEFVGKLQRVDSVEGLDSFTIVDGEVWTCK